VRQAGADSGAHPEMLSSKEREEIRALRKENCAASRERDPEVRSAYCQGARHRPNEVKAFIE
jgi:hypothetical protein